MVSADLRRRVNAPSKLPNVAYVIMMMSMMLVVGVFIASIALGISTADFFENAKGVRDAASATDPATRGILSQQGTIAATTAWLTPLRFIAIAGFLTGISAFFFVIIQSLQLRGEAMRVSLPAILGVDDNESAE